jgi:hypothetical protein
MIMAWTLKSNKDKCFPTFKEMVASFKTIEKAS